MLNLVLSVFKKFFVLLPFKQLTNFVSNNKFCHFKGILNNFKSVIYTYYSSFVFSVGVNVILTIYVFGYLMLFLYR